MDAGKTEYRFLWLIENYSHYERHCRWVDSPEFTVERASWSLDLHPDLLVSPSKKDSIFLLRSEEDAGPEMIGIKFGITLSTVDGSILYSKACGDAELYFKKGTSRSLRAFVHKDKSRFRKYDVFLPKDTLCVMCRMWRGEDGAREVSQCTARSRFLFEKISFLLKVENFSTREINKENTLKTIPSLSETGCGVSAFLEIKKQTNGEEAIIVKTEPSRVRCHVCAERFWVIDRSRNAIEFESTRNQKENLPKLTRKFILSNKDFLPNHELTLMCEFLLYAIDGRIVDSLYDVPMATYLVKYRDAHLTTGDTNSVIDSLKVLTL